MRNILLVSLLMLAVPTPSYCKDNKHFPAITMFLINSKPLMADTVAKATTQFGGQVNAAVAILLSANQGYLWNQIITAIEAGTLHADGSVPGVTPQNDLSHQQAHSISSEPVVVKYPPGTVREAIENNFYRNKQILSSILRAICWNYTYDQIMISLIEETMYHDVYDGLVYCSDEELKRGQCTELTIWGVTKWVLIPDTKVKINYWKDCKPRVVTLLITPKGCWRDGSYRVTIEEASGGYKYTGDGDLYRHSGIIGLVRVGRYEGKLEDEPGYCCGNHGDIWLEQPGEDTIRISSIWYDPLGYIIKETDWQDLIRVSCY